MKKLGYYLFLIAFGIFGALSAQTLENYTKMAIENNPGLKAKYKEFEASMERIARDNFLPRPTLSFGYFLSPVETKVGPQIAKIGLSQMFPWFGTLSLKENIATYEAQAKYKEFLNARNELVVNVKTAWYPIYEANQKIFLQKNNLEILNSYKQLVTNKFRNGEGSMVDIIRIDIMIENTNIDIKLLTDKKKLLEIQFNKILNREDTSNVIVSQSLSINLIENGYRQDSLINTNPKLEAFDLKVKSSKAKHKLAIKESLPKFALGLEYVLVDKVELPISDNGKDIFMPMVSISLPLYRKKYKAAIKESQFNQMAVFYSKQQFEIELSSLYEKVMFELESSSQLASHYKRQIEKTTQAIQLLMFGYSNSGSGFEEILKMQQELLNYKIAEAKIITDNYIALAKLDFLTAKNEYNEQK